MRNSTRGAAAAVAGLVGLALAGCGAGQDALTSRTVPSVPGVNVDAEDGSVLVRNAVIVYRAGGYPVGGEAPVELHLINETPAPIRLVSASSDHAASVEFQGTVEIPPGQMLTATLVLTRLTEPVRGGDGSVPVDLRFDNDVELSLQVPAAPPLEPVPRTPMTFEEEH
jgi:copper(I)-binding protein